MKFLKQLLQSALATSAIVLIVVFLILVKAVPYDPDVFGKFLIGAGLLAVGQAVFLSAIDESIIKVGKLVGTSLMKKKNVWIIIIFGFLFGLVTTLAEPDVQVLVGEIVKINPFISTWLLMSIFGIGCGLLVCLGLVRILKNISLKWLLLIIYGIILILCFFVPNSYIGIAFDAGGVTTGSVTVPFILALALGICAIRGGNNKDDTFGVIAITSTGPILAMLILGLFIGDPTEAITRSVEISSFSETLLSSLSSVTLAIAPLFIIFIITQFTLLKLDKKQVLRIILGFIISTLGLITFLTGIYYGFSAMGYYIGQTIPIATSNVFIILFGFTIGIFFVFTDPSIVVLVNQVEDITAGVLKKRAVFITLALGIACAIAIAFTHVLFEINLLYLIIPLYAICLILNFFIPKMFTAIAFDSGGIASGIMTVAFVFPIATGLCQALGLDAMTNSFGIVGLVATIPILSIQILGLIFNIKTNLNKNKEKNNRELTKNEEN